MFNNVTPACTKRFRAPTAPGDRPKAAHTKLLFLYDSLLSGDQVVDSSELSVFIKQALEEFANVEHTSQSSSSISKKIYFFAIVHSSDQLRMGTHMQGDGFGKATRICEMGTWLEPDIGSSCFFFVKIRGFRSNTRPMSGCEALACEREGEWPETVLTYGGVCEE